jgi:hypothetical protein
MNDGAERTHEVPRLRKLAMTESISRAEDAAWREWLARSAFNEAMPDPARRPPDNPPPEPIIIRIPPRLPEVPEVDRPDDEDEAEIRTPLIIPEMPPPPRPEERPVAAPSSLRSARRAGPR